MNAIPQYTTADLELIEQLAAHEARESFWAFRQYMRGPTMVRGWWPREVAHELQRFYDDLMAGAAPLLILQAPPQHGKSWAVNDFICWVIGKNPELKQIFASFSNRLGVRANLYIQRIMDTERYKRVFPNSRLSDNDVGYQRNRDMLEIVGHEGSFRNTTVNGPVTGEGLDLGYIDDPLKGRREANSLLTRDHTWNWFTDDFYSRFSEMAGLLMVLTRWHIDDPAGRLQTEFPQTRVLRYPAIAEKNEVNADGKLLRRKGEALFPEVKSLEFLLRRKKIYTAASWASVYQQNPIVQGGEIFPVENFQVVSILPVGVKRVKSVRYWDKAGTQDGGKFSAGVRITELTDGRYLIENVVRGQWNAFNREQKIKQTAANDGTEVPVWVEQEPGSGGKESAERTVSMLAGYKAFADRVTGDKETRAEPYAAQVQAGNVLLMSGDWNKAFKEEHEYFPNGPYKDQVDAAGGAFAKLVGKEKGRVGTLW